MFSRFLFSGLLLAGICFTTAAQWKIGQVEVPFYIYFDGGVPDVNHAAFSGVGYSAAPLTGALDSDAWALYGMSDGSVFFGDSAVGSDFGRGNTTGGVSTGGVYAMNVGINTPNIALGVQSGSSDFTPGSHRLRILNQTGDTLGGFSLSYHVYEYNDQGRSSLVECYWGKDTLLMSHEPNLDYISTDLADANPVWQRHDRSIQISQVIDPADTLYIEWYSDDFGGSGSRDEIALDSIGLVFHPIQNTGPTITDVIGSPEKPQSGQSIGISARIRDRDGVDTAFVRWGYDSTMMLHSLGMVAVTIDSFNLVQAIPGQPDSTSLYFRVVAVDQNSTPRADSSLVYAINVLDPLPLASPGDLIISELMINPAQVSDASGEYIEVYNASSVKLDLNEYYFIDAGNDSAAITSSLVIEPGEFVVLARDTSVASNGGFSTAYEYSGMTLSNISDEVYFLNPDGDTIDQVEYGGNSSWLVSGAAMCYTGASHQDNNDLSLWSPATLREAGFSDVIGDMGSPGTPGSLQILDQLVYVGGLWSEVPGDSSGSKLGLVRRGEQALFSRDASLRRLWVEPGAAVDLGAFVLQVSDSVVLEADSTGYSQLIGEVDGQVHWQSALQSSSQARWFNLAIPVKTDISGIKTNAGGRIRTLADTGSDTAAVNIWRYDAGMTNPFTAQGTWVPLNSRTDSVHGLGLSFYSGAPHFGVLPQKLTATGEIVNQDQELILENLPGPVQYNFVANPYPCSLNWDEITADNPGINKTYFIYDDGADSTWVAYNSISGSVSGSAGPMIAPGQSFFVNANGVGLLDITADARTVNANPPLKSSIANSGINIRAITGSSRTDHTYIGFLSSASDGLDPGIDALKRLNGARESPSIYSENTHGKFMYNFIYDQFSVQSISVVFTLGEDEDVSIKFDLMSIPSFWNINWVDVQTGEQWDVRNGDFDFRHINSSGLRHFILKIDASPINQGELVQDWKVVSGELVLYQGAIPEYPLQVSYYDLSGKKTGEYEFTGVSDCLRIPPLNAFEMSVLVVTDRLGNLVLSELIQGI